MKQGLRIGKLEIPNHGILISILLLGATVFLGTKSLELAPSSLDASENAPGPVYLSATAHSCNTESLSIELTWTSTPEAESYILQRRISDHGWLKIEETSNSVLSSFQEVDETETMYRIIARNSYGSSTSNIADTSSLFFSCQTAQD